MSNRQLVHVTEASVLEELSIKQSPLTLQDYRAIKTAAIKGRITDQRDQLLIEMLFGTGLRISEVLRITPRHIKRQGPDILLLVYRGKKRGKEEWEWIPIHPDLGVRLRAYIDGNAILPTQSVIGLKRRMVHYIIQEAGYKALNRPIHPHLFRGLYIKTLMDAGLSVEATAVMVGHEDPRTTMKHYYDLTLEQRADINRRLPI